MPPLFEELLSPPDPADAAERFRDLPALLLLDSGAARDPDHLGRYSFLTADPVAQVRSKGARTERRMGGDPWGAVPGDALAAMEALLEPWATDPVPGLPPFQGGAAGYVGYDWGSVLERLPRARYDDLAIPDIMLGLYDWVVAWDHRERRAWVVVAGRRPDEQADRRAEERLRFVLERLEGEPRAPGMIRRPDRLRPSGSPSGTACPSYPVLGVEHAEQIGLRSTFTHRGYLSAVTRVKEYILAGDIFQANLSQRFEAPLREPPWTLYRRLRMINPAPFSAYLEFDDIAVASASPERFLRLDTDGQVETRPIKGTRPRGMGPMHDAMLGRALAESEKDRAENVMIVDLLRNDLSRVCAAGSVRVPELFALEHHPTVHHLVSTVVGRLAPLRGATDLLRAAFPGGSITGAPKVRAMEIIAELEPTQRAVYCGSIGYLSVTGALDTSIVIRTFLTLAGSVYFQAGGGIVADSDPEQEYRETLDKARALIEALAHP